jgi:hypothetical protein
MLFFFENVNFLSEQWIICGFDQGAEGILGLSL